MIARAAGRWLTPEERVWCSAQPSFRLGLVTVLSCKESVYKACGGVISMQDVAVTMEGEWPGGWASARVSTGAGAEQVTLWWSVRGGQILTLGVMGPVDQARTLINCIVR